MKDYSIYFYVLFALIIVTALVISVRGKKK